ncbi:MAG TPA: HAMP domain-containing sensor histidine kinase [Rhodothermales bacterium]|nr:HAMP domain-containing sensor histidine kinase [Rhodothermales bacterium]
MKDRFLKHHIWLWLAGMVLLACLGWVFGSGWLDTLILERTLGETGITEEVAVPATEEETVEAAPKASQVPVAPVQRVTESDPGVSRGLSFGSAFMLGLSVPVLILLVLLWRLYSDPRYPALALLIGSIALEFVSKDSGGLVGSAFLAILFTLAVTLVLSTHFPLLFGMKHMIPKLRRSWRYREAVRRLHPGRSARWHRAFCTLVLSGLAIVGLCVVAVIVISVPAHLTQVALQAGMAMPVLLILPLGVVVWRVYVIQRPVIFLGLMIFTASLGLMTMGLITETPAAALRYPVWGGLLAFILTQLIVDVYHDVQTAAKARHRINSLHEKVHQRAADLKDMMVQAQAANLAKTQFVSSVSHELRTPLTAISGYAQILLEELPDDNPMHEEFLGIIRQSCERLKSLINDLLDMAKVESGRVELEISSIELLPVLKEITAQLLPLAETKKLQLLRPRIDMQAPTVHADPLRLRQVLINLISNAIKFTDHGCVGVYVREAVLQRYQGTQHSEPAVAIEVFDTGIGISASFIDQLFEPFTQEETAYSNTQQGTGLGLSITKELVERMGGSISVESVVGEGTKFTVLLAQGIPGVLPASAPRAEEQLPELPPEGQEEPVNVSSAEAA